MVGTKLAGFGGSLAIDFQGLIVYLKTHVAFIQIEARVSIFYKWFWPGV